MDGRLVTTLRGDTIVADFQRILDEYVRSHYGRQREDIPQLVVVQ